MSLHKSLLLAVVSLLGANAAQSVAQNPAPAQDSGAAPKSNADKQSSQAQNPCIDRSSYPVIVYDASRREAHLELPKDGEPSGERREFLCDGRPVEIFVINRKLLSSYAATLTNTFTVANKLLDLRGATPPASQPPSGNTSPPITPVAKGINLPAAITNLLTTDKAVGYLLDDETFDLPFNQVSDHAAGVREQFDQLKANLDLYRAYLQTLTGAAAEAQMPPQGELTLPGLTAEWGALSEEVKKPSDHVSEVQFKAWIKRADRLITETSRANTKLQQFPVVDTAINLTASLKTIEDNFRGVRDEEDALQEATLLINQMGKDYQKIRAKNELANTLRGHLSATSTIPDSTLLQIVEAFDRDGGVNRLKVRGLDTSDLCAVGAPRVFPANFAPLRRYCGFRDEDISFNKELTSWRAKWEWHKLQAHLSHLNELIVAANNAQGESLRALNDVYDKTTVSDPLQITNLNLNGASGNLIVYYTLSINEQFNRYQIVNEIAEPISNCQLSLSAAATSTTSSGFVPCTTAAASAAPAPATTLSTSAYPPLQPTPPAGATAPTAPTASGLTNPQEYFGRVEVHHFSHGALVTGVAYDSIKQSTFSWATCLTNANFPNGNPPNLTATSSSTTTPSGACASPTVIPSGATAAPTYYQLNAQSGPTVAVVEGVDLFIFDNFSWKHGGARDMFKSRMAWTPPELYLAASAYPVNHYYLGLSEEPLQGFHFSGGIAGAVSSSISPGAGFNVGSVSLSNPTIPTTSHFKGGFFIEVGFDTSLFGQIFSKSAFSSVLSLGSAGGVAQTAATKSP
jgi:hypothetical protein